MKKNFKCRPKVILICVQVYKHAKGRDGKANLFNFTEATPETFNYIIANGDYQLYSWV